MGEELPWDGIGECDLYDEKPPWEICCNQEGEKVYFFAKLRKLSKSGVARRIWEFCLPACDNSDSEFDWETFMNIVPPEGGDLPHGTLEDFWDGDIWTLFA
jgi:hypothetical protein